MSGIFKWRHAECNDTELPKTPRHKRGEMGPWGKTLGSDRKQLAIF
jgi:hypothetical protein